MEISYDKEADVLYITLRECENTDTVHRSDSILVTKDAETGDIVGYTVMYFSEKENLDIPIDEDIDEGIPA